jgi:hypothetical protein
MMKLLQLLSVKGHGARVAARPCQWLLILARARRAGRLSPLTAAGTLLNTRVSTTGPTIRRLLMASNEACTQRGSHTGQ